MAEKPIKPEEIIDPKFLVDAIIKANEFLAINKELTGVLSENLKISKDALASKNTANNSKELKEQAALTNQINKELKDLETLKKSAALTEAALAKARIENDRALSQQLKTEAEFEKALKKEAQGVQQITSTYDNLRKKYNDLSRAQIELAVRGRENGKVFKGIKAEADSLRATLDKAEQGAGRFQRNVGNYAQGFNQLGNSVNQLTRELPAFAVSAQTGFLAISNNLPIFFDQLERIKKENTALAAEGKKTTSALTQVAGAVFSFGSILSIGVTLLTVYGAKLIEATIAMFNSTSAYELNTEAIELNNTAIENSIKNQEELIALREKNYVQTLNDTGKITDVEKKFIEALEDFDKRKIEIEKRRVKDNFAIAEAQLRAGDKEVEIVRKTEGDKIRILNKSTGEFIKLNKDGTRVVLDNVRSYGENNVSLNEKLVTKNIDLRNKQYERELRDLELFYDSTVKAISSGEGKAAKIKSSRTVRLKEEIDLRDKIRQLAIDDEKDEKQRELEQVKFDSERAKREIDKLKIDENLKGQARIDAQKRLDAQRISLQIALDKDRFNKEAEIEAKFRKETDDAINEDAKKTFEARQKISEDNANFEIQQLQKQYNEKVKFIDAFSLQEINNIERQASAKKVALIKSNADEKAALTENQIEKAAIINEANIAIEKETQDSQAKIAANRKTVLNQALQFEQQLLDAIAKGSAEQSRIRQESFDKQISDADKNIETQKRLAEKGLQNTLAEEEANKVKLERQKQEEKEREIKRQKALAFFKLFASYAEKDPNTALTKALRDTVLAEAVSAAFIEGTENVGKDKQFAKNKFSNGTDGYVARFDGDERILNPEQNKKIGNLSNEALADLAYQSRMGLLDTAKYAVVQSTDFATKINDSALLQQNALLIKELKDVKQAINDKPVPNFAMNQYHEFVLTTIENGFIKNRTFKNRKSRIC